MQLFLDNNGRVLSRRAVTGMLTEQPRGWGLGWELKAGLLEHSGSSGPLAWADPKTGVIGIVFMQYREQQDSDARLRDRFLRTVREAFAERKP